MPKNRIQLINDATPLNRREMFTRAAGTAATLFVAGSALSCGAADATDPGDDNSATGCVLTAALTEGPYFVDERLNRSDLRADPVSGAVSTGTPLQLTFNVSRSSNSACSPLTGALIDVWHCDAAGVYSDVGGSGSGRKFLRGYQITDASGVVNFTTVYPGWYQGRAVHIHFKVRVIAGTTTTYEFTSQFFFDESVTSTIHAASPYNTRGQRDTRNTNDGIYNSLSSAEKTALTLRTTQSGSGYNGVIDLVVRLA